VDEDVDEDVRFTVLEEEGSNRLDSRRVARLLKLTRSGRSPDD
jgi:hypothetical protein